MERGQERPVPGRVATKAAEKVMSASTIYTLIAAVSLLLVIGGNAVTVAIDVRTQQVGTRQ